VGREGARKGKPKLVSQGGGVDKKGYKIKLQKSSNVEIIIMTNCRYPGKSQHPSDFAGICYFEAGFTL
jgi:hypothetical protein